MDTETVNLVVCKDVTEILGAAVGHTHDLMLIGISRFFLFSTGEAPMAGEVGVGAIGAGDFLRFGPLDDMSGGRRH